MGQPASLLHTHIGDQPTCHRHSNTRFAINAIRLGPPCLPRRRQEAPPKIRRCSSIRTISPSILWRQPERTRISTPMLSSTIGTPRSSCTAPIATRATPRRSVVPMALFTTTFSNLTTGHQAASARWVPQNSASIAIDTILMGMMDLRTLSKATVDSTRRGSLKGIRFTSSNSVGPVMPATSPMVLPLSPL